MISYNLKLKKMDKLTIIYLKLSLSNLVSIRRGISIQTKSNISGVKTFTTTSLLFADKPTNSSEEADVNTSAQDNDNSSLNSNENAVSESDSFSKFESHKGYILATRTPERLTKAELSEAIRQSEDVKRHPEELGLEGEDHKKEREFWWNRDKDLREDYKIREQLGMVNSPAPSEGSCTSCKQKNYVSPDNYYLEKRNEALNANNVGTSNSVASIGGNVETSNSVENPSSVASIGGNVGISVSNEKQDGLTDSSSKESTDKPSFSTASTMKISHILDDDSTETRPAKRIKQDSSDITSDGEPFDFGGGDD